MFDQAQEVRHIACRVNKLSGRLPLAALGTLPVADNNSTTTAVPAPPRWE
jgi:hypothetical protein